MRLFASAVLTPLQVCSVNSELKHVADELSIRLQTHVDKNNTVFDPLQIEIDLLRRRYVLPLPVFENSNPLLYTKPYISTHPLPNEKDFIKQLQLHRELITPRNITHTNSYIPQERRLTMFVGTPLFSPRQWQYNLKPTPVITNPKSEILKEVFVSVSKMISSTAREDYFDCALINYYPPGDNGTGIDSHSDPNQDDFFCLEKAVLTIGCGARFNLRSVSDGCITRLTVFEGDVVFMVGECQKVFRYTVLKRARGLSEDLVMSDEEKEEMGRISIVFKRS